MRIHIATFDAADDTGEVSENGLTYNGANCMFACFANTKGGFLSAASVSTVARHWLCVFSARRMD